MGGTIIGIINLLSIILNTLFWCVPLYFFVIAKLLIPNEGWRKFCTNSAVHIAENWISVNSFMSDLTHNTEWRIVGDEQLSKEEWYLVISNHQSWTDIFVLQYVFNRKIPFLKFFIKQNLIYVPVIGLAWWGLDFPFMKRYSRAKLEKFPELRGKDLETTRRACEKFKESPVSIMNFMEGTRYSEKKKQRQEGVYGRLLNPKAGGMAFVLSALDHCLNTILDVTIAYPTGSFRFWDFLCGRTDLIVVDIQTRTLPEHLASGDYANDSVYKSAFQQYVTELWREKDGRLSTLVGGGKNGSESAQLDNSHHGPREEQDAG